VLPYVWLSLAILWLWLPPQSATRQSKRRLAVSAGWLTLAIAHAHANRMVNMTGIAAILAFVLVCYTSSMTPPDEASATPLRGEPHGWWRVRRIATSVAVIALALALMAHAVPGFSNLLIVRNAIVSPGAVPYTLYLNFDKALIGLALLAFGPPLVASRGEWAVLFTSLVPRLLVVIAVVMVCALWLGHVRLDLKWPAILPVWAWANLLFTCVAEEALFRGVIQRQLQGEAASVEGAARGRALAGLALASLLFGIAHYAGGTRSVVLATIAGTGYGWVFWRTGRIEGSILTHFAVNATHLLCFTYPARM
jgi:membrane protease YdiL (CAAX protease family)